MVIYVKNKRTTSKGEYIGRPTILGNKYEISETQSREVAIKKYASWLWDAIYFKTESILNELDRLFSILIKEQELTLLCWCSPKHCHGDIIKQFLLNKYHTGEYI